MGLPKYRPSNGTEGISFIEHWCGRCVHDKAYREDSGDSCPIVAATLALDLDHPNYPTEWVESTDGPRCTAFLAIGDDPELAAARADKRQLSLLGDG